MNVAKKLVSARAILERHGVAGLLAYLYRWLVWRGYDKDLSRVFLYVLDSPRPAESSIRAARTHTFRFATQADLETLRKDASWQIAERNMQAFKQGDRCFLQLDGDNLVGYTWLAASPLVEITWGFHCTIPDDTVYNYKGMTAPAYRGEGYQSLRHLKLLEHIRAKGQQRLFAYVDQMNLSSLKGIRKSGYRKVGVLRAARKRGEMLFSLKVSAEAWRAQNTLERSRAPDDIVAPPPVPPYLVPPITAE